MENLNHLSLIALHEDEVVELNGGYCTKDSIGVCLCGAGSAVKYFVDGFGEGFKAGVESWGRFF